MVQKSKKLKVNPSRTFVAKDRGYLTPHMRKELTDKIKALEFTTKNIGNAYDKQNPWVYNPESRLDVRAIHKKIASTKRTIENHTPPVVTGKTKDLLWKRAKELERLIRKEMPTKDEMHGDRKFNSEIQKYYQEARNRDIDKQVAWTLKQQGNVREWKQIMRTLEPDDPRAANVDRLRKGHSTAS